MSDTPALPAFANWPSFPFEGDFRVKKLDDPVAVEPDRRGEGDRECLSCRTPDDAYIWVGERWRVRAMDRPSGLPMVLILETRSHYDLGDLPNLLAAELGVMTVRLERAIRSLDGVARVHVNRWGDGSSHLHLWFLARPYGRLQLRGTFLPLWDDILPPISEQQWRQNLALVAAWLADFEGRPVAAPPRIEWQAPASFRSEEASPDLLREDPAVGEAAAERDRKAAAPAGTESAEQSGIAAEGWPETLSDPVGTGHGARIPAQRAGDADNEPAGTTAANADPNAGGSHSGSGEDVDPATIRGEG